MKNTGERHIVANSSINEVEYYNHLMHLATYRFAEKYALGKRVLDYGCGSGYGSYSLSRVAEHVIAVDISDEALIFARNNYKATNIEYCLISEFNQEKFDMITSFQVIEHVPNSRVYIAKLKKLLKPNGILLISTPDKKFRLFNIIQKPWNIYHLKEYSEIELMQLVETEFNTFEILKIGSNADFIQKEITRTEIQKRITLPFTLLIYPNFLRVFFLKTLMNTYQFSKRFRKTDNHKLQILESELENKYTLDDIEFSKDLKFSTDLLVICTNTIHL